jgi:ABC-2 type transport system ATP-binding protein
VRGADVRKRVEESIGSCLLEEVADRKVENLSRGYRQRAALAGALVHHPSVLILDEPTVGLDPAQIIRIREAIRRLGRERAVLLSTHILPEVDAVCDRVLIIDRGRIVAEGTAADLRSQLAGAPVVRATFAGMVDAREALENVPGVAAVSQEPADGETRVRVECVAGADPRDDVFRTAVARGWVMRELVREALSLEDVFVRLTRQEEPVPEAEPGAAETPEEPAAAGPGEAAS